MGDSIGQVSIESLMNAAGYTSSGGTSLTPYRPQSFPRSDEMPLSTESPIVRVHREAWDLILVLVIIKTSGLQSSSFRCSHAVVRALRRKRTT